MTSRRRLTIPSTLAVVALTGLGAGCGTTVDPSDGAVVDANSINHGDVIRLNGGMVCIPPSAPPDSGETPCGDCYNADGQLGDCSLCAVGPDGGLEELC